MNWVDRLERKYRRFGIRNLVQYIIALNVAFFLMQFALGGAGMVESLFAMIPELVLQGQVWRLITFALLPQNWSIIWIFFTLYIFWMIGSSLTNTWGTFKFTLYYLTGMIFSILGGFLSGGVDTGTYLNLSCFLAFAMLYPNVEFMIFFILPVKVKYLGLLSAGLEVFFIIQYLIAGNWAGAVAIVVSLANFLLFFWDDFARTLHLRRSVNRNRKRFFDEVNRGREENIRRFRRD